MQYKKYFLSFFYYMVAAFGISLTIKAEIGVSSLNSLNVAISQVSRIEVGTITTLVNIVFLIACIFVEKNKKIFEYLFMILSLICFGSIINIFLYHFLIGIQINNYYIAILVFTLGTIIAGYGTGRSLHYGILKFPVEKLCLILSDKTKKSFALYRYGVDIICIFFSLFISLTFNYPLFVREGTILSFLLLTYVINKSKK